MGSDQTQPFKSVYSLVQQALKPKNKSLIEFLPNVSYETKLKNYFDETLSELNQRNTEEVQGHLETIKTALEKDLDRSLNLLFGGSISKHTYANGISDVDMLVILNSTEIIGKSPKEVLKYFEKRLREQLPGSVIVRGNLAVTVKIKGTNSEIQLLPALKTNDGYRISSENGKHWSNVIRPYKFAEKLTEVNKSQGNMVLPMIKLFKKYNASLPDQSRLKGYHIESLAIKAFKDYKGSKSIKDMILHFVEATSKTLKNQIKDVTGQSDYVDGYLGNLHSFRRRKVCIALKNLSDKMQKAESEKSVKMWKDIVGD